jgi:formylglycine-generating enzyme required for sulfatase activity
MRGGSFYSSPAAIKISSRYASTPGERAMNYGIRVAKSL